MQSAGLKELLQSNDARTTVFVPPDDLDYYAGTHHYWQYDHAQLMCLLGREGIALTNRLTNTLMRGRVFYRQFRDRAPKMATLIAHE